MKVAKYLLASFPALYRRRLPWADCFMTNISFDPFTDHHDESPKVKSLLAHPQPYRGGDCYPCSSAYYPWMGRYKTTARENPTFYRKAAVDNQADLVLSALMRMKRSSACCKP